MLKALSRIFLLTVLSSLFFYNNTFSQDLVCPRLSYYQYIGSSDRFNFGETTQLQTFLKRNLNLSDQEFIVTGYFGRITYKFVRQFQLQNNLIVTGQVGRVTRGKIQSLCSQTQSGPNASTVNIGPDVGSNLVPEVLPTTVSGTSCRFGPSNINITNGSSIGAYKTSTAVSPETCLFEIRSCTNGVLSGSFEQTSCSVVTQGSNQNNSSQTTTNTTTTSTNSSSSTTTSAVSSSNNTVAQATSTSSTRQISSSVVVANMNSTSVGGFALYARNSPHFAKAGNISYFALNASNTFYVYRKIGDAAWSLWGTIAHDFHRAPSLFVDKNNNLHIVSENAAGRIVHVYYSNANTNTPGIQTVVDTTAWGTGNYYIGGTYNNSDGILYLCATYNLYDGNEHTKCGTYNGTWVVKAIQSYTDHVYLYPNMLPLSSGGVWLDMGAYPLARGGSAYPSYVRTLNALWKLNSSLAIVGGTTYGSAATQKTYFNNDITHLPNSTSEAVIFPVRTGHLLSGAYPDNSLVYSFLSTENFSTPYNTGLQGSLYTAQTVGNSLYLVGGGNMATSLDGKIWKNETYEIPGYSKSDFTYGVAQTLQVKGDGLKKDYLNFVQELTRKSDGTITILEVQIR